MSWTTNLGVPQTTGNFLTVCVRLASQGVHSVELAPCFGNFSSTPVRSVVSRIDVGSLCYYEMHVELSKDALTFQTQGSNTYVPPALTINNSCILYVWALYDSQRKQGFVPYSFCL